MKKRIMASIMAVVMLLSITTIVGAAEISGDGWEFDRATGTLTITNDNGARNWRPANASSTVQLADVKSVEVANRVTRIGNGAFDNCVNLTEVTLPSGLARIEYNAFRRTGLTSVTIPATVTQMSDAFNGADNLTAVVFENGMHTIPDGAMRGATALTDVTFPNRLTRIEHRAFSGCTALTEITFPSGLARIDYNAFTGTSITSVTIPSTITHLSEAFSGANLLTTVVFQNGIHTIPSGALRGASAVTSVTIPNSVTRIDSNAFRNCTALTAITLPSALTRIDYNAFMGSGITSVTIPATVTQMSYAFDGAKQLETVVFMDGIQNISSSALRGTTAVKNLTIPDSVTRIHDNAFRNCAWLTEITLPSSLTRIDYNAFMGTSITSVTIPSTVTNMSEAFSGAKLLTNVVFEDGITTIPAGALRGAAAVSSVTIPRSVTRINDNAFRNCRALAEIALPSGLTRVDYNAFMGTSLKSVIIPATVTNIGRDAFGIGVVVGECIGCVVCYHDEETCTGCYLCDEEECEKCEEVGDICEACQKLLWECNLPETVKKVEDFIIYGTKLTAAQKYANDNGFMFVEYNPIRVDCADCEKCNPEVAPNAGQTGHVLGGETVTTADALEILIFIVKIPGGRVENCNNSFKAAAILNGETITTADALEILKHIVKLPNKIDGTA